MAGDESWRRIGTGAFLVGLALAGAAGCADPRCYADADCDPPRVCDASGACVFECADAGDCPDRFRCAEHRCEPMTGPGGSGGGGGGGTGGTGGGGGSGGEPFTCPDDMVPVGIAFCIDRHEASRPDATATAVGSGGPAARSVVGVLPWMVDGNAAAAAACAAAGKRLCEPLEWQAACEGPDHTAYPYGDDYEPRTCNGVHASPDGAYHLRPTGSYERCRSAWGAFDLSGNVWEHVAGGSDSTVRGGAFNCADSTTMHRCRYIPESWTPSARGFRCCLSFPEGG